MIKSKYGDDINITYHNYPVGFSTNSNSLALASKCADSLGNIDSFNTFVFANQDSLTSLTVEELAVNSGSSSIEDYIDCSTNASVKYMVEKEKRISENLKIDVLPTFIIEDTLISGIGDIPLILQTVEAALSSNKETNLSDPL